ncbi:MAG: hypothetical protein DIZ80_08030 [endosymbiont of Galathealinum brachiosum]|uniref:Uncharacterized protein n=1 Tax=endosymbiont of Galathealinum brachiosum TaxID=2200906 RepID=A0A370DGQ5_9GAMM|nr:MAG: hypothetical protein DIZ80_08030 [endosymbiont of Galathealinum brachiosum]
MELLDEIFNINISHNDLVNVLTINHLPRLCNSIDTVISDEKDKGVIYCVWGQHRINREEIKNGVRFYFPTCPNELALCVTRTQDKISIVCTTNTEITDDDFIDSIMEFQQDWVKGTKLICGYA